MLVFNPVTRSSFFFLLNCHTTSRYLERDMETKQYTSCPVTWALLKGPKWEIPPESSFHTQLKKPGWFWSRKHPENICLLWPHLKQEERVIGLPSLKSIQALPWALLIWRQKKKRSFGFPWGALLTSHHSPPALGVSWHGREDRRVSGRRKEMGIFHRGERPWTATCRCLSVPLLKSLKIKRTWCKMQLLFHFHPTTHAPQSSCFYFITQPEHLVKFYTKLWQNLKTSERRENVIQNSYRLHEIQYKKINASFLFEMSVNKSELLTLVGVSKWNIHWRKYF